MAVLTLNGLDVIEGRIVQPRMGAWHADVIIDGDSVPTGACVLASSSGLSFKGTVARGGDWLRTSWVRVAAGAGGMGKAATAKHYRGIAVRTVVGDLLRASGDALSTTADQTILATRLQAWTQMAGTVGRALSALCGDPRTNAATWRLLPDGTLWIGRDTWPDSDLIEPDDYQDADERPSEAWAELGFAAPLLQPGTTLGGRRIDAVQHVVTEETVRTSAWFAS